MTLAPTPPPQSYFDLLTIEERAPYIAESNKLSYDYYEQRAADPAYASRRKVYVKQLVKLTSVTTAAGVIAATCAFDTTPRLKPGRPRATMPVDWVKLAAADGSKVVYHHAYDDSVWFTVPPRTGGRAAMDAYLGKVSKKAAAAAKTAVLAVVAEEQLPAPLAPAPMEMELTLDELMAAVAPEAAVEAVEAEPAAEPAAEEEAAAEEAAVEAVAAVAVQKKQGSKRKAVTTEPKATRSKRSKAANK
jgi:hypothetical protein